MKQLSHIAFFGVDLQNCFGHPKGGLYVKGGEEVIEPSNRLIEFAVERNCTLLFSADWHPPDSDHFKKWPVHGVAGTWDSEFLAGLMVPPGSHRLYKAIRKEEDGYDPFEGKTTSGATAKEILETDEIDTIMFFGIATDYCVKAGVLTACKVKKFRIFVALNACRSVNINPGDEKKAIEEMKTAGATMTTVEEVLSWNE